MRWLQRWPAQCALPSRDTTDEGSKYEVPYRARRGHGRGGGRRIGRCRGIASAAPGKTTSAPAGGDFASGNFTSIPSGNYASITVTGVCNIVPDAVINVTGNINVAPGAVLDAQSAPSTITVGHNVTAGAGSLLGMGCQPTNTIGMFAGVPCSDDPDGHTIITVNGNITATDADTVLLRKVTVGGNITLTGGGGDIPWSIKGNTIGGNLTISDVTADWLGVQFNTDRRQRDADQHHCARPGRPGPDRRRRGKHGREQPHLLRTRPRRVRRVHPRRGQPRRSQRDSVSAQRSVGGPDLT